LKEHVLEQMREPRASGTLVRRSYVIPQIHGDNWRSVIFRECDRQPVVEPECLNGDAHDSK
jgi:hypothetical protein